MAEIKVGLTENISAYEIMKRSLERDNFGKWVVVHDKKLAGTYGSLETAADYAVTHFGRGPYLIRRVGAGSISLPASVLYRPVTDHDAAG